MRKCLKWQTVKKQVAIATPNDLKLMINLLQPTFFIPVQGEYRSLLAHAELANELGIPYKNIFIPGKGDVVEIENGQNECFWSSSSRKCIGRRNRRGRYWKYRSKRS